MPGSTDQRRAWITGAGKGIGRALALRMARDGWQVAASARTVSDLESLVAEGPAGGIQAFPLDVTDLAATEAVFQRIEDAGGPLDLVVLNAGTYLPVTAEKFAIAKVRTQVEVNLMGPAHGIAQVLPRFMARRRGQIAVVASVAGYRGLPTSAVYGATKAALINMCEALKVEAEPYGVKISVINPGFVKTPLTDKNTFPMPFLISADEAADHIVRGLAAGKFEIAFPWAFATLMKLLRLLPDRLFFALARRMRPTEP